MDEFKYIPGFPNYKASPSGCIKSCKFGKEIILKPCPNKRGYLHVTLYDESGRKRTRKVHHLVMLVFVGPKPRGLVIDHEDRNRFNNALTNLRYVTSKVNGNNISAETRESRRLAMQKINTRRMRKLDN